MKYLYKCKGVGSLRVAAKNGKMNSYLITDAQAPSPDRERALQRMLFHLVEMLTLEQIWSKELLSCFRPESRAAAKRCALRKQKDYVLRHGGVLVGKGATHLRGSDSKLQINQKRVKQPR